MLALNERIRSERTGRGEEGNADNTDWTDLHGCTV
jgi:hypothetical protein